MFKTKNSELDLYLGKERKTALKIQLLFFLSDQEEFVTSKEISTHLNIKNPQQTQQLCRELETDLKDCYKNNEFQLIISKVYGCRLQRTDGNLDLLLNSYHYTELSYNLLTELFYKSPLTVSDFCKKYYVSEATARRKVRQLNQNLSLFNIRITFGRNLTLVGSEEDIRAYYLLSNYLTYQNISNLPLIDDVRKQQVIQVATHIAAQLNPSYTASQIEVIALLYGVQDYRIKILNQSLQQRPTVIEHFDDAFFTENHAPSTQWSIHDWHLFLFYLYLFNLYRPEKEEAIDSLQQMYQTEITRWKHLFSHFFPETPALELSINREPLIRLFHFHRQYPEDIYLFHIFPLLSLEELTQRYPLHMKRFEHFFNAFICQYPTFNTLHFQVNSLLLTLSVSPLDQRKERIYLYLESLFPDAHTLFLKTSLLERLQIKYHIVFVDNPLSADLTISTVKHFTTITKDNHLSVHPLLLENDYLLIEKAIDNLFSYPAFDDQLK